MVAAAVALLAGPISAQAGQFKVGPRLGYVQYAEETGIEPGGLLGVDALYRINRNLSVGLNLAISRPETDGQYFPAELSFGDTTFVYQVTQPLTISVYQLGFEFTTGGSFAPFLAAAVGGYRVDLDPQAASGNRDFSNLGFTVGGGIQVRAGESARIRLDVYDMIFTSFDRDDLNVTRQLSQPILFPDVVPPQPPFSGTAHNIVASLGFYFTPGGN